MFAVVTWSLAACRFKPSAMHFCVPTFVCVFFVTKAGVTETCVFHTQAAHHHRHHIHTRVQIFRDMLRADCEGRAFSPPPPSAVPPPVTGGRGGSSKGASAMDSGTSSRTVSKSKGLDDWGDDWGDGGGGGSDGSAGFGSNSEYTRSQLENSAAQKESFFARKQAENGV